MYVEAPFTAEMARTMTAEEVQRFWQSRQQARRDAGRAHYTECVDAGTGEVLYGIDGKAGQP